MSHVKCQLGRGNATVKGCWGLMHLKLPVPTGGGEGISMQWETHSRVLAHLIPIS